MTVVHPVKESKVTFTIHLRADRPSYLPASVTREKVVKYDDPNKLVAFMENVSQQFLNVGVATLEGERVVTASPFLIDYITADPSSIMVVSA